MVAMIRSKGEREGAEEQAAQKRERGGLLIRVPCLFDTNLELWLVAARSHELRTKLV